MGFRRVRSLPAGSLLVALLALAAGCSAGDEATGEDDPDRAGDDCDDYGDALCDWLDRCAPAPDRAACEREVAAIVCREGDTEPARCASGIDAATCERPPSRCELTDVADAEPAIVACDAYARAVCQAITRCGGTQTMEACEAEARAGANCDRAYGVLAGYDQCLSDLPRTACGDVLPESCVGVLLSEPAS